MKTKCNVDKASPHKEGFIFSIVSLLDGKEWVFEKSTLLAQGSIAKVYALKNNGLKTRLVCKEIELEHPKGKNWFTEPCYGRNRRFFEAIHEINGLYIQGLLIGYAFKNDVFYIVMNKIAGSTLGDAVKNKKSFEIKQIYYEAFKKMQKLHRKGYAHLDIHSQNVMISAMKPYKATLIDFSTMQPVSTLGNLIDYAFFSEELPKNCSILEFYIRETKEYYQKHPRAVVIDVFNVLISVAIYQAIILQEMTKALNIIRNCIPNILLIPFFMVLYLHLSDLWNSESFELFQEESAYDILLYLYTLYTEFVLIYTLTKEFIEDYLLPERVILKNMDLFFTYVHPIKESMLTQAKKISNTEALLSKSYAQKARMFSLQEHSELDTTQKFSDFSCAYTTKGS